MFQVSDELLSQLPPQQFAPQQQVSGGGLQHGGAGREIRLTARYGSHPYQPVISQATSEASSSSLSTVCLRENFLNRCGLKLKF